jgi:hypothetical protein
MKSLKDNWFVRIGNFDRKTKSILSSLCVECGITLAKIDFSSFLTQVCFSQWLILIYLIGNCLG